MKKFDKIFEDVMDDYEAIRVSGEREMRYDDSGGYSVINSKDGQIRLDWMTTNNEPVFSLIGQSPAAIYKRLVDEFEKRGVNVSMEHAMYIGKELQRASTDGNSFVQEQFKIV
jgi:hypothetical protein